MHVFIAGVMQGDRLDNQIDDQDYRVRIAESLQTHLPGVQISDPWVLNPGSVDYDEAQARSTFLNMTVLAGEADLLIAYLPTVSMGTAMEMWQAFQTDTYIVAVTPHVHHWAIRFTANEVLPDLNSLEEKIQNGHYARVINQRLVDAAEDGE